jgi:hypothetical protein
MTSNCAASFGAFDGIFLIHGVVKDPSSYLASFGCLCPASRSSSWSCLRFPGISSRVLKSSTSNGMKSAPNCNLWEPGDSARGWREDSAVCVFGGEWRLISGFQETGVSSSNRTNVSIPKTATARARWLHLQCCEVAQSKAWCLWMTSVTTRLRIKYSKIY